MRVTEVPQAWLRRVGNPLARLKPGVRFQVPGAGKPRNGEQGTGDSQEGQKSGVRRQGRDDFGFWIGDFGFGGVPKSRRQENGD